MNTNNNNNSRMWHNTSSSTSRSYLPDPYYYHSNNVYDRATSASTSPSGQRPSSSRRNSKPDRFLQPRPMTPHFASRSQEDIRSHPGNLFQHQFRPSSRDERGFRERSLPHPPSQCVDSDEFVDTSTDDDLDVVDPHQRMRTHSQSRGVGGGGAGWEWDNNNNHNYFLPGRILHNDDQRMPINNNYPSRTIKPNDDPEMTERQRRTDNRRASLHSDVIRNCNDYSSTGIMNRNDRHRHDNPTIQLHFGGQDFVHDFNQYSNQATPHTQQQPPTQTHRKSADKNMPTGSLCAVNDADRSTARHSSSPSSRREISSVNTAFQRLNFNGPSSRENASYY